MTEMCDECGFPAVAPGDCDEEPRDCLSTAVEMSSLPGTSDAQFFPCSRSRTRHPKSNGDTCGSADDLVRTVEMEKQNAGVSERLFKVGRRRSNFGHVR